MLPIKNRFAFRSQQDSGELALCCRSPPGNLYLSAPSTSAQTDVGRSPQQSPRHSSPHLADVSMKTGHPRGPRNCFPAAAACCRRCAFQRLLLAADAVALPQACCAKVTSCRCWHPFRSDMLNCSYIRHDVFWLHEHLKRFTAPLNTGDNTAALSASALQFFPKGVTTLFVIQSAS